MSKVLKLIAICALIAPAGLAAQSNDFALNIRGGINVPTFDITDIAEAGPGFGFGLQAPLGDNLFLRANADFGTHNIVDGGDLDVKVNHFIAGVGLPLADASGDSPWRVSVNLGAGLLAFDIDGAPETLTYFAINAGAEIEYVLSEAVSLLLSPQGDIAFVDTADGFTGSTAWVWPVTAGLKIRF